MTRIVTIFGATGLQGGSVLDAVLKDGTLTARAVTRNVESDSSKALAAKGVQLVQADLSDRSSVEKAVSGSEAVFGVTNSWDPALLANPALEIEQGINIIEASKAAAVKFYVWSSLPSISELSKGKYTKVHHYDNKSKIDDYLAKSGLPYASVQTSAFAENLWRMGSFAPHPQKADTYAVMAPLFTPTAKQLLTFVGRDVGPSVLALLKNYDNKNEATDILGKTFPIVSVKVEYPKLAEKISEKLGKPVEAFFVPSTGMDELDEMCKFQADGLWPVDREVPDAWFVKHGVKYSTVEDIAEEVERNTTSKK